MDDRPEKILQIRVSRRSGGRRKGGVAGPLLSNILLTPFDREMRRKGYQLTRYADDWGGYLRVRSGGAGGARGGKSCLEGAGCDH